MVETLELRLLAQSMSFLTTVRTGQFWSQFSHFTSTIFFTYIDAQERIGILGALRKELPRRNFE